MDIPEYYKIIVMVANENILIFLMWIWKCKKKKKKLYNLVVSVQRILSKTVVKENKMEAWPTDKESTKL